MNPRALRLILLTLVAIGSSTEFLGAESVQSPIQGQLALASLPKPNLAEDGQDNSIERRRGLYAIYTKRKWRPFCCSSTERRAKKFCSLLLGSQPCPGREGKLKHLAAEQGPMSSEMPGSPEALKQGGDGYAWAGAGIRFPKGHKEERQKEKGHGATVGTEEPYKNYSVAGLSLVLTISVIWVLTGILFYFLISKEKEEKEIKEKDPKESALELIQHIHIHLQEKEEAEKEKEKSSKESGEKGAEKESEETVPEPSKEAKPESKKLSVSRNTTQVMVKGQKLRGKGDGNSNSTPSTKKRRSTSTPSTKKRRSTSTPSTKKQRSTSAPSTKKRRSTSAPSTKKHLYTASETVEIQRLIESYFSSSGGSKQRSDLEGKELAKEIIGLTAESMHTAAYSILLANVLGEVLVDALESGGGGEGGGGGGTPPEKLHSFSNSNMTGPTGLSLSPLAANITLDIPVTSSTVSSNLATNSTSEAFGS